MKHIIDRESFDENLHDAIRRVLGFKTDAEIAKWAADNQFDLNCEIEGFLREAVARVAKPREPMTAPVLDFGRIRLWVYDAGQGCPVGEHRSMQFGGDNRAGLVYEERDHGHRATEYNIHNESTWQWIGEWMRKGFAAEGLLGEDGKLKRPEVTV